MAAPKRHTKKNKSSKWRHVFLPTAQNGRHPHALRSNVVFGVLAFVLFAEITVLSGTTLLFRTPSMTASVLPAAIVDLTNTQRADNGLSTLQTSDLLTEAAQNKANDMAAKGYFSHVSPDGTLPWAWITQVGYQYQFAGENLAVNFDDSDQVVTAWMNSPEHRANILDQHYTQIGIGIAEGIYQGQETTFVVQFFADPEPVVAAAAPRPNAPVTSAKKIAETPATIPVETAAPAQPAPQAGQPAILGEQNTQPAALQPTSIGPFATLAASPHTDLTYLLLGLALIFLFLLVVGFLPVSTHFPHPNALMSGGALVAIVFAVLIVNESIMPGVDVSPADSQHASVVAAFR